MLISIENIIIIVICVILSILIIIFINRDKFSLNCKKNKEMYFHKYPNVTYVNTVNEDQLVLL
jgi:hypothetical protein